MVSNAKSGLLTSSLVSSILGMFKNLKIELVEYLVSIYILVSIFFEVLRKLIHPTGNKIINKSSTLNTMH